MEIKELGEFALIDKLTGQLKNNNESSVIGIGDDCSVLHYPNSEALITTDLFLEGIHFDLTYIDMRTLGYKLAMESMSNVFAMNGQPRQMLISFAIDKRFRVEDLEQLYDGLKAAAEKWHVDIVGGDTEPSMTGLTVNITTIGEAAKDEIVHRSGANETDLICVSGDLGGAYMGLQLLEREKSVYYQQIEEYNQKVKTAQANKDEAALKALRAKRSLVEDFQPDFAGKEYLIDRQLKPEARGDVINLLASANIHPTAMIDVSDGLASDVMQICHQSHCGCRIYEKDIPIDYQTATTCEEFNMNLTTAALNGGEDYELLFTVPIGDNDKIEKLEGIKRIGYITKKELGMCLVTRDGNEFELKAQGWDQKRKE